MDIKDVLRDIQHKDSYTIEQRLDEMIRKNPSYRHLSQKNQDLLLDLLGKYKEKVCRGIRVSSLSIRRVMYRLHYNRIKSDLTKQDLELIRKVLNSFKS